jgi:choline-sulfatase
MPGTWFARQGQQYLRDHAQSKKPFFLVVSFYEPHSPFHFPVEYRQSFDPQDFGVPAVHPRTIGRFPKFSAISPRTETPHRRRLLHIDDVYGLQRRPGSRHAGRNWPSGNTMVVYLGDHGYSLGQHGRFEKHTQFEESVHAATVDAPAGLRTRAMWMSMRWWNSSISFPPSPIFCGIDNPPDIEGRSLLPLLKGETAEGRKFVFSEYYDNEEAMVRNRHYKFIYSTANANVRMVTKPAFPCRDGLGFYTTNFSIPTN